MAISLEREHANGYRDIGRLLIMYGESDPRPRFSAVSVKVGAIAECLLVAGARKIAGR